MSRKKRKINKQKLKKQKKAKRTSVLRNLVRAILPLPGGDPTINLSVFLLACFGTAMIASVSVGETKDSVMVVVRAIGKQLIFLVAFYLVFILSNKLVSIKRFLTFRVLLLGGFIGLMLVPFLFPAIGGSHAWIQLFGISIQPSEFGKPLMIFMCASSIYQARRHHEESQSFFQLFKWPLITFAITVALLAAQKDYGTLLIISGIMYFCMMVPSFPSIRKVQRIATFSLAGIAVFVIVFFGISNIGTDILAKTPLAHIAVRIENAKNPFNDIYGSGYQPANSLYGIADSNFIGKGFGNSSRKYGYLTQADNDYILAVTIEETGIIGFGTIIVLYGLIVSRLFYYALRTRDIGFKTILVGTGAYLFMHFALNVGGVGALIPMTGIPLLFISSGGSSLMAISIMLGQAQRCIALIKTNEMKGLEL